MIILKTPEEIGKLRKASLIVATILKELSKIVKPDITTLQLDKYAEKRVFELGAVPAFKGYKGFPATICASINNEVVHGIPSKRKLKTGNIISIDLGVEIDDFFGDAAITIGVGEIQPDVAKLISVTRESLYKGIEKAVVGNRLSDISSTIQKYVESFGYSVVKDFVGHGIGRNLHEEPQIPNYGLSGRGPRLKAGMVLALEPMVNMGNHQVNIETDNWTAVTLDGSLSAHWEHTIAITKQGPVVLSQN